MGILTKLAKVATPFVVLIALLAIWAVLLVATIAGAAADTPISDLTGNWNVDITYQGYDTSGEYTIVITSNGGGSGIRTYNVTGQQHTYVGGLGGDICDETVSGSITTEPDHVITDSHGTNYVTFGTAFLFAVPSASGCPKTRAPWLHLAIKGLVGDDCDSKIEATAPPFVCNEHLWTSGPNSYANRSGSQTKYPIVGSILYPDAENTNVPEMILGSFDPITSQFWPGYWINRSYSCFVPTSAPVTIDPSMVVVQGTTSLCGGGALQWLPVACLLPDMPCYAPAPGSTLGLNLVPGDAYSGGGN